MNTIQPNALYLSVQHLDALDRSTVRCLTLLSQGTRRSNWMISETDTTAHARITPPITVGDCGCGALTVDIAGETHFYELDWPIQERSLRRALEWAERHLNHDAEACKSPSAKTWFGTLFGQRQQLDPTRIPVPLRPAPAVAAATLSSYLGRLGLRPPPPASLTVLVVGSPGSGKTSAIEAASDQAIESAEVMASDGASAVGRRTRIALDYGEHALSDGLRLRLFGMPGQLRFVHMIEESLGSADGVLLLVNAASKDPLGDVRMYGELLSDCGLTGQPVVVGLTHTDVAGSPRGFQRQVDQVLGVKSVLVALDVRNRSAVTRALGLLAACCCSTTRRQAA